MSRYWRPIEIRRVVLEAGDARDDQRRVDDLDGDLRGRDLDVVHRNGEAHRGQLVAVAQGGLVAKQTVAGHRLHHLQLGSPPRRRGSRRAGSRSGDLRASARTKDCALCTVESAMPYQSAAQSRCDVAEHRACGDFGERLRQDVGHRAGCLQLEAFGAGAAHAHRVPHGRAVERAMLLHHHHQNLVGWRRVGLAPRGGEDRVGVGAIRDHRGVLLQSVDDRRSVSTAQSEVRKSPPTPDSDVAEASRS